MTYYLIRLLEGVITIDECTDSEQRTLKYMGEESQEYEYESFWRWWRRKVEYKGENTAFIIITDMEQFDVPEDIQIFDIKSIDALYQDISYKIPTNSNIITKPKGLDLDQGFKKTVEKKVRKLSSSINSLESYFIKKTASLRS